MGQSVRHFPGNHPQLLNLAVRVFTESFKIRWASIGGCNCLVDGVVDFEYRTIESQRLEDVSQAAGHSTHAKPDSSA